MPFRLDEIVPWGRSLAEYTAMFNLSEADLKKRILGCGDGPASFNSELRRQGGEVISIDPIYQFTADEIRSRVTATRDVILAEVKKNRHEFVWEIIPSPEVLEKIRLQAMNNFLKDFLEEDSSGHYLSAGLPDLPFKSNQFDLALSSHFLFLYSEQFSYEFHLQSILEMCRVAAEVRIFPLLELGSIPSRHLTRIIDELIEKGYRAETRGVNYEFQKGGNELLKVHKISEMCKIA